MSIHPFKPGNLLKTQGKAASKADEAPAKKAPENAPLDKNVHLRLHSGGSVFDSPASRPLEERLREKEYIPQLPSGGKIQRALPEEYVHEMDRQRAFKNIIENFEKIDAAHWQNLRDVFSKDGKIVRKDLEKFLEANPNLKHSNPELYESIQFLLNHFDEYADGDTWFHGKSISKESLENFINKAETDPSLWPDYDIDSATGWPVPKEPFQQPKATWEEQKAFNDFWDEHRDIGEGTKPPEGKQAENYLSLLAYEAGLFSHGYENGRLTHQTGLDPALILELVDTSKYAGIAANGGDWQAAARADMNRLQVAYEMAGGKEAYEADKLGAIEKLKSYYNDPKLKVAYTMAGGKAAYEANGPETIEKTREYYNNPYVFGAFPIEGRYQIGYNNDLKGVNWEDWGDFTPRKHQSDYKKGPHDGNDIFAPRGTPVVAPVSGTVVEAGYGKIAGNYVIIQCGDAYFFLGHLDSKTVEPGMEISAGTPIGTVGNTGSAAGTMPHVHFEVYTIENGKEIHTDPFVYLEGAHNASLEI